LAKTLTIGLSLVVMMLGAIALWYYREATTLRTNVYEIRVRFGSQQAANDLLAEQLETLASSQAARVAKLEQELAEAIKGREDAERRQVAAGAQVKSALDLIRDQELHVIYPDLQPFDGTRLAVHTKYLASVDLSVEPPAARHFGREVHVQQPAVAQHLCSLVYDNRTNAELSPSVSIFFFDHRGIVTAEVHDVWIWHTVGAGERRVETVPISFEHGTPVYWRAEVR